MRHIEQGVNVPMYRHVAALPAGGRVSGPLVVSMRPVPGRSGRGRGAGHRRASRRCTARPCTSATRRRWASPTSAARTSATRSTCGPGEVPVFWACGVTPQAAVMESRPSLAITHAPGHMLITDARDATTCCLSAQWAAAGSTSSISTPPASLGCTKLIRLSDVPRRGSSYSSRSPRSRRTWETASTSVTR